MSEKGGPGDFLAAVRQVQRAAPEGYHFDAYLFVFEALDFTVSRLTERRHVSGRELLEGIRDFGLKQFGLLTRTVFAQWGVKTTADFGRIVFLLVEAQLMGKTDQDTLKDFENVYDFESAFDRHYLEQFKAQTAAQSHPEEAADDDRS